ncbi:DNA polymerase I [Alicyclobacillaceae bacterium I2511]|nr:DNA polymerase I [Alicyclobacillaceae bacterium I2511]
MSQPHEKLLLVDGNSITYRAFFALPPLSNAEGRLTNAVFGFIQMLLKVLRDEQPTHVVVAFDAAKKTFRHDLYAAYKGTRDKTPNELSEQFPLVREVLTAFGIVMVEQTPFEADDIIGTLSLSAEQVGLDAVIVSGDKDLLQLVSPHVQALLTRRGVTDIDRYNPAAVMERFHLTPAQIVDLKGLMGDSSDNIPGVPGVGEKTAIKLLTVYPTVEEVLAHMDQISGVKLRERLMEHQQDARMSKQLATIRRDVPLPLELENLRYHGFSKDAVRRVFMQLGFQSLLESSELFSQPYADQTRTNQTSSQQDNLAEVPVTVVQSREELSHVWPRLGEWVGIIPVLDAEDYQTANLLGFALGSRDVGYYISLQGELEMADLQQLWSPAQARAVFDLKALTVVLDGRGETLKPGDLWFDGMIASYLLNPSDGELTLSVILERELHRSVTSPPTLGKANSRPTTAVGVTSPSLNSAMKSPEQELTGSELTGSELTGSELTGSELAGARQWAAMASLLPELKTGMSEGLRAQGLDDLYYQIELPLEFVLARMEVLGFRVNPERLKDYGRELEMQIGQLTQEIYTLAGTEFNLNSPKQMGTVLFDKLGLPAVKKTKTGYSTSADVLEKLAPYHEVVAKILDYRQLAKLQSTYVEGLLKVIRPETGRVHTRFHQALTATGRLSSSEPNLQNIPIRVEEGRKLRRAFEPSYEDWVILSADYSQIELRILAHISRDEALIDAFRQGLDIHTSTASKVFGVSLEEVTPLMRRQAKAVNFGIVYGISDYGLSQNLNIPRAAAAQFIADYFAKFPGVARYMEDIVAMARSQGYVTTLLNRRRYLQDIRSSNYNLRSFAERTAMNTPIQGTAADIIKLAMVRIDKSLMESTLQARMLLQVHDELIFECPVGQVSTLTELVQETMENALILNVPLKVDIHSGKTWYDAK